MTSTIHVLRRRNWRFAGEHLVLLPGRVRLQSFTDADEAEKVCRENLAGLLIAEASPRLIELAREYFEKNGRLADLSGLDEVGR